MIGCVRAGRQRSADVSRSCGGARTSLGKDWSEWQDLNLRPPRPERGALPDCATLRRRPRVSAEAPASGLYSRAFPGRKRGVAAFSRVDRARIGRKPPHSDRRRGRSDRDRGGIARCRRRRPPSSRGRREGDACRHPKQARRRWRNTDAEAVEGQRQPAAERLHHGFLAGPQTEEDAARRRSAAMRPARRPRRGRNASARSAAHPATAARPRHRRRSATPVRRPIKARVSRMRQVEGEERRATPARSGLPAGSCGESRSGRRKIEGLARMQPERRVAGDEPRPIRRLAGSGRHASHSALSRTVGRPVEPSRSRVRGRRSRPEPRSCDTSPRRRPGLTRRGNGTRADPVGTAWEHRGPAQRRQGSAA